MKTNENELASIITDTLNGSFNGREFCEAMSHEHRYLQNEFTRLCINWLGKAANQYASGEYDGRNEFGCYTAKRVTDFLYGGEV